MTDLTPKSPAVHILAIGMDDYLLEGEEEWSKRREDVARCLAAALPYLSVDELPDRLVRDIQSRTIRATTELEARAEAEGDA